VISTFHSASARAICLRARPESSQITIGIGVLTGTPFACVAAGNRAHESALNATTEGVALCRRKNTFETIQLPWSSFNQ
jgi:hypothetical protein